MNYAIKLNANSNRSITWCDDNWYETDDYNNFHFSFDEVLEIVQKLRKHFQYKVTAIAEDGSTRYFEFGKEIKPEDVKKQVEEMISPKQVEASDDFDLSLF